MPGDTHHGLVSVLVVIAGARGQRRPRLLLVSNLIAGEELAELLNAVRRERKASLGASHQSCQAQDDGEPQAESTRSHSCKGNSVSAE